MIFTSAVLYFDKDSYKKLLPFIESHTEVEVYEKDIDAGKLILVISTEDDAQLEVIQKNFLANDLVIDFTYHAIHFGESVDKLIEGKIEIDFEDINSKKKNKLQ